MKKRGTTLAKSPLPVVSGSDRVRVMKRQKFMSVVVVVLVASFLFAGPPAALRTLAAAPARGKHAMVASQHELATRIGLDIMRRGGNAVDAAIAVGIALAVVYPEAGNLGGIRAHMNASKDPACHTMNASLEKLLAGHKIGIDDARAATTDRIGFAEMV